MNILLINYNRKNLFEQIKGENFMSYSKKADGRYQKNIYTGNGYKCITAKTVNELKQKELELRKQIAKGLDIASQSDTLKQWADRLYEIKKVQATEKEYKTFKFRCDYFIKELGNYKLTQIKQMNLQPLVESLFIENPTSHKPSSERTIMYYINALSQVFEYAIENRITEYNPCKYVRIPKNAPKNRRRAISPDERERIANTPHIMQTPCLIALYCGLRRGELSALQWSDIDFTENTIRVSKSMNFKTGKIKAPKTESGDRIVPMPDLLVNHLKSISRQSTFVCVDKQNRPLTENTWKRLFEDYLWTLNDKYGLKQLDPSNKELTIERFTLHCLRHTYATILYSAGVDVKSAKELLGHSDVTTTLRIYTHLEQTTKVKSISKLNDFIKNETVKQALK